MLLDDRGFGARDLAAADSGQGSEIEQSHDLHIHMQAGRRLAVAALAASAVRVVPEHRRTPMVLGAAVAVRQK